MLDDQTIPARLLFTAKVAILRARRTLENLRTPLKRWPQTSSPTPPGTELRTPLYVDPRPEERAYELGKIANLRAAIHRLNGTSIPAGGLFSFWHQLGRTTQARGFVPGRMLQSGCVVPSIGGGLCQLSNSLYELALRTGCEIVERHPHSQRLPGTPLRDATVAWNYIDLRFRPRAALRIDLRLTATELIATFVTDITEKPRPTFALVESPVHLAETCATCHETNCSRHQPAALIDAESTAFLVDSFTPEFDRYIQATRTPGDHLVQPIDGTRWHLPQYGWSTAGFNSIETFPVTTLIRSLRMRKLSQQGAARQTEAIRSSALLASHMAKRIPHTVSHIVVEQTLLSALWESGCLGGRTFDVLMRRLPMRLLQQRLDAVAARWPQSPTAADFRASSHHLDLEEEALSCARRLITPHHELAALFPGRAIVRDWITPSGGGFTLQTDGQIPRFFFPGPVAARKGAYLLREALEGMPVELLWRGSELEGPNFWGTLPNRRVPLPDQSIAAVVQPAFLEDQPRTLLRALACGVPVIATAASGLPPLPGVTLIDPSDPASLRATLQESASPDVRQAL